MASNNSIKNVFIHLGVVVLITLVLAYVFFYMYLPKVTHHGEAIEVPDVRKKNIEVAERLLIRNKLIAVVYDSTYEDGAEALTVINQFPKQGEKVKSNRKIYLTIRSKNPPLIKMPKLIASSLKSAEITIKSYGLQLGNIRYIPSVMENAVLEQWVGSKKTDPGALVPKGATVSLVVGNGISSQSIIIPDLVGTTLSDADNLLRVWGLEKGSVVYDENSTDTPGTIIKQKPMYIEGDTTNKIKIGEIIDLWVAGKKQ